MKRDPIENTPEFKDVIDQVELELDEMLKNEPGYGQRGFCHRYWSAKKELLKKKYKIDWKTPAQMNPTIHFD